MISTFQIMFLIIIGSVFKSARSQNISVGWQSTTNISSVGFQFSPIDQQALFLFETNTTSLIRCTQTCHSTGNCRILDFDSQSRRCRLFEGDIATMGSIVPSSSSQSRVGSVKLHADRFLAQGQSCSFCEGSRYLRCVNGTCQCQSHTYFDGSICQSQKLLGSVCYNNTECRVDLNYTCLPRQQCGMPSMQVAVIVAGNINGTQGSDFQSLKYPTAITLGMDNLLYVADGNNSRVLQFQQGSLVGSVVAGITGSVGTGNNQFNLPSALQVDNASNIYVIDNYNFRVMFWRKNASSGVKVVGTGSPTNAPNGFYYGAGISVDTQGNIYLCDSGNHRVLKFSPNATNAIVIAGVTSTPGNTANQLNTPYGIHFDEVTSYLYVADYNNHRIQRYHVGVSTNGTTVAGGNGAGSGSNQLNLPTSLSVSKITNAIYIADSGNNRIQRWSIGITSGVTIAGNGALINNGSTSLQGMMIVRLSNNESYLFVCETNYNRVWRFPLI